MTEHAATDLFNRIAEELHLSEDWTLRFDRARRRFGQCNYTRKQISLSRKLVHLNDASKVEATIRHEIAHALVGPGHGHDVVWRRMAIRCGDDGHRCYGNDVVTPEARYLATCHGCGKIYKRHRMIRGERSCGTCSGGRFNPAFILKYETNTTLESSELIMMNQTTLRAGLVVRYNDALYRVDHCNQSRARIVPLTRRQLEAESFDGDDRGGVNISASACVDIIEDIAKAADELDLAKEEAELARLRKQLAAEQATVPVINIVPAASGRAARGAGWQRSKAAAPAFRPGSLAAAVLAFVVVSPGLTAAQIAEAMGGNAGSVKAFVSRFFHDGLIEPFTPGRV